MALAALVWRAGLKRYAGRGSVSVLAYLRLFRVFLKVGVLNELEYRVNFYVQILRP